MKEQEFETIIKPLILLDGKQCQFMRSALLGNFKKWNETKQLPIDSVLITSKCYHYNHEWKSDNDGGVLKYCNDCKCYV